MKHTLELTDSVLPGAPVVHLGQPVNRPIKRGEVLEVDISEEVARGLAQDGYTVTVLEAPVEAEPAPVKKTARKRAAPKKKKEAS